MKLELYYITEIQQCDGYGEDFFQGRVSIHELMNNVSYNIYIIELWQLQNNTRWQWYCFHIIFLGRRRQ